MDEKLKKQIMDIRDTGLTNMLDWKCVQYLAYKEGYYDLVNFLEEHHREYVHFIIHGDED